MTAKRTMNRMTAMMAVAAITAAASATARADLLNLWQFNNSGDVGQATTGTNLAANGNAAYSGGSGIGGSGALLLDGAGDFLSGAVASLPTGDSSYTVSGWFNTTTNANMGIVGWGNYGTNGQVNATRTAGANDVLNYSWGGAYDLQATAGAGVVNNGVYHHVVATYDAATGIKTLYFDGNAIGARTVPDLNVSSANFRIGSTNSGEFFNGTIDDVAIYDEAFAPRDVKRLTAGAYASPADSTLAHRYGFNGNTVDSVGGANLTLNGGASVASGTFLDLPGGGTRVHNAQATGAALTALANTINSADSITMEAWFNVDALQNWSKLMMAGSDANTYMDITPRRGDNALVSGSINDTAHAESNVQTGPSVAVDTQYYIATTWRNSGNEMSVLIRRADGTVVASYEEVGMGGNSTAAVNVAEFYLGSAVSFGDPDLDAQIDEFRIWNKAMSQARSLANLVDGPNSVDTTSSILIDEDWEGNNSAGPFPAFANGAVVTGTSAVVRNVNYHGLVGGQNQIEIVNNDTGAAGTGAIFNGRSIDLNQYSVEFAFSLATESYLELFVEYGSPNNANGPTGAVDWRVFNAANALVASGIGSTVSMNNIAILNALFQLGLGDYRLVLSSTVTSSNSGIHVDGVFLRAEAVPAPAALPAGLAMLALAASRRRRRR